MMICFPPTPMTMSLRKRTSLFRSRSTVPASRVDVIDDIAHADRAHRAFLLRSNSSMRFPDGSRSRTCLTVTPVRMPVRRRIPLSRSASTGR